MATTLKKDYSNKRIKDQQADKGLFDKQSKHTSEMMKARYPGQTPYKIIKSGGETQTGGGGDLQFSI